MAALHELDLSRAQTQTNVDIKLLLPFVGAAFWGWLVPRWDDVILKKRIVFFSVTLRVRDCYGVFVKLFGPPPVGVIPPEGGWPS